MAKCLGTFVFQGKKPDLGFYWGERVARGLRKGHWVRQASGDWTATDRDSEGRMRQREEGPVAPRLRKPGLAPRLAVQ